MTEPEVGGHHELPRSHGLAHPRRWMLRALRPAARAYTRRRYGARVHHAERVPATGQVILAGNHVGWLDGPLMAVHSPRLVHALTKREMFIGRMDRVLRGAGQIPIDRFAPDPGAIKASLRVLRDGGVVGIFPEGARGTGEFTLVKRGAAYLAIASGAPVVPVIFFGTRDPGTGSHARPARGGTVDIVFGEPWQVPARRWPRRRAEIDAASEQLRVHLLRALADAKTLTGRELPGPLPSGDSEREATRRQATT